MRYKKISSQLFINNRDRFTWELKAGSLAIFNSNDEMPRNGIQNFPYRQQSDLFYLTGIEQEQSILLVFPDCPVERYKEILFLKETSPQIAIWDGPKFSMNEAKDISGISTVMWLDDFDSVMYELMAYAEHVYLNLNENVKFSSEVPYRDIRFAETLKRRFPAHQYQRAAPIMSKLRLIKSSFEIEIIQYACHITCNAFKRVLRTISPGMNEYEIQAELDYEFLRNGANGHAYQPIIASGRNACILHYIKNDAECKNDDLLLMDFGCEYANYASDLTRTIPVNGKFSKRQRDCYEAVLRVFNASIMLMKTGNTIEKLHIDTASLLEKEMTGLGLFTESDIKNQDPEHPLWKKYYPHGTSHFIGLEVHDPGGKQQVFVEGMILSCEPAIYIPEENMGIRIENDILITDKGPVDLMKGVPVLPDEIEYLMSKNNNRFE